MKHLLILSIFFFLSCSSNKEKSIEIPEGKVGLIGYGSLTSKQQMESQLGKPYNGPVEIIHLKGYQRTWTATTPNLLEFPPVDFRLSCLYKNDTIFPTKLSVLNIEKNDSVSMNCCFFIIDEDDLITIDKTEVGYKRIDVANRIEEFEVSKGKVWAYQAEEEFFIKPDTSNVAEYTLPRLYLDFLENGFSELGDQYRNEFYSTTAPIPTSIILDCDIVK